MGTGTTAGPFPLTYQVIQTFGDTQAQYGETSTAVQVQNSSGFVLQITSGGDVWTIQPLTAATIPTQDGNGITVYPAAISAQQTGSSIYLVWLLPGQVAPMQDGPLSSPLNGIFNLASSANNVPLDYSVPTLTTQLIGTWPLVSSLPYVIFQWTVTTITGTGSFFAVGNGPLPVDYSSSNISTTGVHSLLYIVQPGDTTVSFYAGAISSTFTATGAVTAVYGSSVSQPTPADVTPYGGLQTISLVTTDTSSHTLLPAPPTGFVYRIHSANLTLGASGSFMKLSVSGAQPFCTIAASGTGFINLGGRLINGAVLAQNTATSSAGIEVGYDIVQAPLIN